MKPSKNLQKKTKRLFVLKDVNNNLLREGKEVVYFDNKMKAKEVRDVLNNLKDRMIWHVSKGPDHILYRGRVAA